MAGLRHSWVKLALAAATPVAVASVWLPLREQLPNTDLALLLVLVIGAMGWLGGVGASIVSAVAGAGAFDLLDTRPYGALTMSRGVDVLTALVLLSTGVLIGAGAARLARYRRSDERRDDAFAVVMEASGLVATGGEQSFIAGALAAELVRGLELADCHFWPRPPDGYHPMVARDGSLIGLVGSGPDRRVERLDLPVWFQGEVVGHFGLILGERVPSRQELRVALTFADQAGAAMANPVEPGPPRPRRSRRLRLLGSDTEARSQVGEPRPGPPSATLSARHRVVASLRDGLSAAGS